MPGLLQLLQWIIKLKGDRLMGQEDNFTMRVVIQRVKSSQVEVNGQVISRIGRGLNILAGIAATDTEVELGWMTRKCLELRLFPAREGGERWEKSVQDIQGELLVVSQFTLYGDCPKGRRPSFSTSASPQVAEALYHQKIQKYNPLRFSIITKW
jgi:D-tyrosyl-tRNA(Tyr) deacylase